MLRCVGENRGRIKLLNLDKCFWIDEKSRTFSTFKVLCKIQRIVKDLCEFDLWGLVEQ